MDNRSTTKVNFLRMSKPILHTVMALETIRTLKTSRETSHYLTMRYLYIPSKKKSNLKVQLPGDKNLKVRSLANVKIKGLKRIDLVELEKRFFLMLSLNVTRRNQQSQLT